MKSFWTCGPFKQAHDRHEGMKFRIEQMAKFMEILGNLERIEEQIVSGSIEEKYLALMLQQDAERDLRIILGIGDDRQEQDSEILRKTILESFTGPTKE